MVRCVLSGLCGESLDFKKIIGQVVWLDFAQNSNHVVCRVNLTLSYCNLSIPRE